MNSIESSFRRKTLVIFTSVFLISLVVVSVSYSSFSNIGSDTNNYVVENFPITTTYSDNDVIDMSLEILDDDNGLELNGKSFSISNFGDLDELYYILIENTNGAKETDIKVSVDSDKPVVLANLPVRDGKRVLTTGIVKKRNELNDVAVHNVKMWAISTKQNVNFKISVESEAAHDIGADIIKTLNIADSVSNNLLSDPFGNIRFYGENPNNYVKFNNELWRIVGVFDLTSNDGRVESRIKIVRDENLEERKFISNKDYAWDKNIGFMLSEYAANSLNEKSYNMIDYIQYNLGSVDASSLYRASDYYSNEMSSEDSFGRSNKVTSIAGLLTLSDYYYASNDGLSGNWLNSENGYWLMNNYSSDITKAFVVSNEGKVEQAFVSALYGIRPCVYLNSTVRFVDGDGSISRPYILE